MNNENGWEQYSKLVLRELEILGTGIKHLNENMNDVKKEITAIKVANDAKDLKVETLLQWKGRIDEVVSPTQLNELKKEVEDLKAFKVKAIAIFAFVQFLMAAVVAFSKFM